MTHHHRHSEFNHSVINLKSGVNFDSNGIRIGEDIPQVFGSNDVFSDVLSSTPKVNFSLFDDTLVPEYSNITTADFCSSNESHTYLNVTCEFPISYAEPMYG